MKTAGGDAYTHTLDDFIAEKYATDITYYNLSILEKVKDSELLQHNLIEDYIDEFELLTETIEMSNEEYKKYRFAPDILAFDVYGSTQLDFIILYINDMADPKEFDRKTVKLIKNSVLKELLSQIYSSNKNYLDYNRRENNIPVV